MKKYSFLKQKCDDGVVTFLVWSFIKAAYNSELSCGTRNSSENDKRVKQNYLMANNKCGMINLDFFSALSFTWPDLTKHFFRGCEECTKIKLEHASTTKIYVINNPRNQNQLAMHLFAFYTLQNFIFKNELFIQFKSQSLSPSLMKSQNINEKKILGSDSNPTSVSS